MTDLEKSRSELIEELNALRARVAVLEQCVDRPRDGDALLSGIPNIYRTAPIGLCVLDREMRYAHINEMLAGLSGRTVSEHIGRRPDDLIPQFADRIKPPYEQVMRTGQPVRFGLRAAAHDDPQRERDWLVHYEPIQSSDNEIVGVSVVVQDVTEQKQSSAALKEVEEIRRSITESSPDFILQVDRKGTIQFINRTVPELTIDQVVGTSMYDYILERDRRRVKECLEQVIATGKPGRFEIDYHNPSGLVRTFELHVGPILREREVVDLTIVARDITSRKQTELELSHRESQYRSIFENTSDGLVVLTPEGSFVDANPAACRMHGCTRDEFLRHSPHDFIHPDSFDEYEEFVGNLRLGRSFHGAGRSVRKDGTVFDHEVRGTPFDYAGQPHFLAILRDVTDRNRAEQSLRQAHDDLNHLMNSLSDYLWSAQVDRDGTFHYRYYSPVVERITGRPVEFFTETPERWLSTIHPDDRSRLETALGRVVSGQSLREEEEYRVIRPDGSIRWVRDSATVYPLDDGGLQIHGVVSDITERKEREVRLQQLSHLYMDAADPILFEDMSRRVIDVNREAERAYGWTRQELIGESVEKLIPPERREIAKSLADRCQRGEVIRNWEGLRLHKNGSRIPILVTVSLFTDESGNPAGIASIAKDITHLKQTEAALRASEERFRMIFNSINDAIFIYDKTGKRLDANRSAATLFGYSREELLAGDVGAFSAGGPRYTQEAAAEWFRHAVTDGQPRLCEWKFQHPSGRIWWANKQIKPVTIAGQDLILGVVRDVTAQKEAEARLRESEQRFRTVVETMNEGLAVMDKDLVTTYVNERFCKILGYEENELIGKSAPSLLGKRARHLFTSSRLRRYQGDLQSEELSILRKDGRRIDTLISPSPLFNAQGRITGSFFVVMEITQLKEATEELRRTKEDLERRVQQRTRDLARINETLKSEIRERTQAEEKVRQLNAGLEQTSRLRVLGEVAAGIAHQLHQPLTAIACSAEGCRRRLDNGQVPVADLIEQLQEIAAESLRAGEIIRRIRAFVAEQQLARAPLDVNQVARDALRLAKFSAEDQEIRLDDQLADDLPAVLADGIQLIHVVLNLVLNGMEAMADVEPDRRTLCVQTQLDEGSIRIDVIDRGTGIDPGIGEEIFDQFYSTKPNSLGMGLAMSRSIVEAHGGSLWYESTPGTGTVFRFTLPLLDNEPSP